MITEVFLVKLLKIGNADVIGYQPHEMWDVLARLCLVIETERHSHWRLCYFTGALAYTVTLS